MQQIGSSFRTFIDDLITMFFSLLTVGYVVAVGVGILAIYVRFGMIDIKYEFLCGFLASLIVFYCFKGKYNPLWSVLQIIVNAGLTLVGFSILFHLLEPLEIKRATNFSILLISLLIFVALNKRLLDFLTNKIIVQKKNKSQKANENTENQ